MAHLEIYHTPRTFDVCFEIGWHSRNTWSDNGVSYRVKRTQINPQTTGKILETYWSITFRFTGTTNTMDEINIYNCINVWRRYNCFGLCFGLCFFTLLFYLWFVGNTLKRYLNFAFFDKYRLCPNKCKLLCALSWCNTLFKRLVWMYLFCIYTSCSRVACIKYWVI